MKQNPLVTNWARGIWELAMETEKGLQLTYPSRKEAFKARFDLYLARRINRKELAEILNCTESPWDEFRISLDYSKQKEGAPHCVLTLRRHATPVTPQILAI